MTDPETIEGAVRELRREGWKAAFLYASIDAVLALLVTNFLVTILNPAELAGTVGGVPVRIVVSAFVGVAVFGGEFAVRARQYTISRLEADNPQLGVAFRTARDVAGEGGDTTMARMLYDDAIDRLEAAASTEFVDARRLAVTLLVIMFFSVATVQAAVFGIDLTGSPEGPTATANGTGAGNPNGTQDPRDDDGLRDPDEILGEEQNVSSGDDPLAAEISQSAGGNENEDFDVDRSDVVGGDPTIESQRAGYDPDEDVEDAALIRDYNLRIQASDDDE